MSDQDHTIEKQGMQAISNNSTNSSENNDDEISLLDLVAVLVKHKWLIIIITPNVYTPKATMLISSGTTSSLSSLLSSSGLSGLASMAGVSAGGNPNQQLAKVLATSNTTLDRLNQKFDLTTRYKIKKDPISSTRKAVLKNLSAAIDEESNIFTISFTDKDPVFAKEIVDETVTILSERFAQLSGNQAIQQKALLEKRLADVDATISTLEAHRADNNSRAPPVGAHLKGDGDRKLQESRADQRSQAHSAQQRTRCAPC